MQDVFSKALSGVETANFEFPLVTKAGKSVEILLNATTRRDERDLIIGVVGIGQDITARVAQEQEYSRLIDTANAPIFGVNVDGCINVWNKNAETVTEFSRDDVKGKNLVRDFIREEHRDRVQEVFTKALNGDETANFEFPLVTKAGKSVEILLNATTRRDELGNVIGVVGAAKGNFGYMMFGLILSVVLTGALATYLANYIQRHLWIAYVGLGFILLVALQLIIGGLNDYGVLSINETFKKYF